MLNKTGPSTDPQVIHLVTGLKLDFVPLTTTLYHHPLAQAVQAIFTPPHCLYMQPILPSFTMRISWEMAAKALPKPRRTAPAAPCPIHQTGRFAIEARQVGQA